MVYTEGVLEENFCYYLEMDSSVIEYQCQPLGYCYFYDDQKLGYISDFKVVYQSDEGQIVIYYEDKRRKYIDEEFERELEAKKWSVKNTGSDLILVDDEFIMKQPKLINFKRVYTARRRGKPRPALVKAVASAFSSVVSISATELMESLQISIGEIYQLVHFKILVADFEELFGPHMMLWRGNMRSSIVVGNFIVKDERQYEITGIGSNKELCLKDLITLAKLKYSFREISDLIFLGNVQMISTDSKFKELHGDDAMDFHSYPEELKAVARELHLCLKAFEVTGIKDCSDKKSIRELIETVASQTEIEPISWRTLMRYIDTYNVYGVRGLVPRRKEIVSHVKVKS